jgi:hypothetical protein
MHGFPSRPQHAFAPNGPLAMRAAHASRIASPRCAGATPTNGSGPKYPKAGTAGHGGSIKLEASHPSAQPDDDRKGKPGANRGRKATGLGA